MVLRSLEIWAADDIQKTRPNKILSNSTHRYALLAYTFPVSPSLESKIPTLLPRTSTPSQRHVRREEEEERRKKRNMQDQPFPAWAHFLLTFFSPLLSLLRANFVF